MKKLFLLFLLISNSIHSTLFDCNTFAQVWDNVERYHIIKKFNFSFSRDIVPDSFKVLSSFPQKQALGEKFWAYALDPLKKTLDAKDRLFFNRLLPACTLQKDLRVERNLESNLILAQEKHSEDILEVQFWIKEQFLEWENEQQEIVNARWIQNDALRNHLGQYGWHYVGGVVALVVGYCAYKWVKNKKVQQGKGKGAL